VAQRGDERKVLGDVGNTYEVFQNEQVFAFGDNIVDSGDAKWERAGMLRDGRVIFGAMELCHLGITVPGDDSDIKPYLLLINSFDGSTPAQGILAYIRPVCENTFEMARGTATEYRFSIRHTGSLDGKVAMAREALGIAFKHNAEVKDLVTRMALTTIVDQQVQDIFRAKIWPVDVEKISDGRLENHASTKAFENYMTSSTIDGIRGTVWGAFNAVTEFTDHVATYGGDSPEDTKADAILFGRAQMRKDRAMDAFLPLLKK
jgi:phage/plasmid-like protein (TIGR03299 family)